MPYNPLEQPHAQRCTHVNCFGSILLHSTSYPSTPLCQCILCGIAPSGGCSFLTTADYVDRDTEKLVEELGSENRKTRQIVRDMLEATDDPMANGTIGFPYSWWPDGMGHERYNEMLNVAIGHFDEDGVCEKRGELVRDGRGVELRRVDGYIGYAEFDELLRTVNGKEERVWVWSSCTVHDANPNFMLCEPCFLYLEAWLVLEGLPRRSSAFPSHSPEPLSFVGEFYEIVNSQKEERGESMLDFTFTFELTTTSVRCWYSTRYQLRQHRRHA